MRFPQAPLSCLPLAPPPLSFFFFNDVISRPDEAGVHTRGGGGGENDELGVIDGFIPCFWSCPACGTLRYHHSFPPSRKRFLLYLSCSSRHSGWVPGVGPENRFAASVKHGRRSHAASEWKFLRNISWVEALQVRGGKKYIININENTVSADLRNLLEGSLISCLFFLCPRQ